MLASVIIPGCKQSMLYCVLTILGLTIKALTKTLTIAASSKIAEKTLHTTVKRFGPTACGLAAIPFIIRPIDHAVDHFMDDVFRPSILHKIVESSKA